MIEIELHLSTGASSLKNCVLDVAETLGNSSEDASKRARLILLEAAERLKRIEGYFIARGFETARDTSQG